ncbi:hypothetical protein RF11_02018 [Thelohanellus kitauei]|uniref:Uncharacterized protein n=1 Tax=Thelohanellus kitauei TaxID=669202 RepID=A0A0C2MLD0_THEKT|nr:hypothetical protein RF11_02018 [Thelohanellus kitauei]
MTSIGAVNFVSQVKLKIHQIHLAPPEHKKILIEELLEFINFTQRNAEDKEAFQLELQANDLIRVIDAFKTFLNKSQENEESFSDFLALRFRSRIQLFNPLSLKHILAPLCEIWWLSGSGGSPVNVVDLSNGKSNKLKSRKHSCPVTNAKSMNVAKSNYMSETIPKIYGSIVNQLRSVIKDINESLSTFYLSSNQPRDESTCIQFYLLDAEIQLRFKIGKLAQHKEENKSSYSAFRNLVMNIFAPLLESYLKLGLVSKKNRSNVSFMSVWELILVYFDHMNGQEVLKKPIWLLASTFGPNVVDIREHYNDLDFLLFLINQLKKLKSPPTPDLFSRFVLEAILRGKLAMWMKMIWLEWIEIIYCYEKESYVLSSGTEKFIASFSNLRDFYLDIDYYF